MSLDRLLISAGNYLLINAGGDKFDLGDGVVANALTAGNFGVAHTFLAYTPTAQYSNGSYPVANLYDYKHPKRKWKSSASGRQWVKLDLGSAKAARYLALYNCNFSHVEIIGTDSSDAPVYYSSKSWPIDERVNRYKVLLDLPGTSVRYLYIVMDATLPEIGAIVALEAAGYKVMDINPEFDYTYQAVEAAKVIDMESGTQERTQISSHLKHVSRFNFGAYARSKEADHFDTMTKAGKTAPILYWENSSDGGHEGDKVYLCYLSSDIEVTWHLPQFVKSSEYKFEEVV